MPRSSGNETPNRLNSLGHWMAMDEVKLKLNRWFLFQIEMKQSFFDACIDHFYFLIDKYNCTIIKSCSTFYNISLTYANSTTGIEIGLEPRENYIFLYLIKLHDGKVPGYLTSPESWIYLDAILSSLSPPFKIRQKPYGDWLKPEDVKEIVTNYARALKRYGSDVLSGDFKIFTELKKSC